MQLSRSLFWVILIIEAELFKYHKTITPKDIILPEVGTLKGNNNDWLKRFIFDIFTKT